MEIVNGLFPTIETLGDRGSKATSEEIAAFASAVTRIHQGPVLWNMFNALAFLILVSIVFVGITMGQHQVQHVTDVKMNWKENRCKPWVMPIAGFYGHDTVDNFQFCMRNIFQGHAQEVTSPFTSVLSIFSEVIGRIFGVVNSIYENIATMGGGIQVIFQDFTDRIMNFFFQLRLSAIRIKNLIGRMHALLFSVMFMGMSGMKGAINFSNTTIFKFLATFCFVPETRIEVLDKGTIAIADVKIGDTLLPTRSRVTAKFHFVTPGQPMVDVEGVQVSAQHYVLHEGEWIQSMEHPKAIPMGGTQHSLICLNTEDHQIPIRGLVFRDYDEGAEAGYKMMQAIEARINGLPLSPLPTFEYSPTMDPSMQIRMADGSLKRAMHIVTNDRLRGGGQVIGILQKEVYEICAFADSFVGAATLVWRKDRWIRIGTVEPVVHSEQPLLYRGFVVLPHSQIEVHTGDRIRDYVEIASPDIEEFYQEEIRGCKSYEKQS